MRPHSRKPRYFQTLIGGLLVVAAPLRADIGFKSGSFHPPAALDQRLLAREIASLAARPDAKRIVVQFPDAVNDAQRVALAAHGLRLLTPLDDHAWFAAIDASTLNAAALAGDRIRWVGALRREWKLDPGLARAQAPIWSVVDNRDHANPIVTVNVQLHADAPLDDAAARMVARHGGTVRSLAHSINTMVVELPLAAVPSLADEDSVQWIEPPLPLLHETNADNRARTQADNVQAPPYNLSGAGVTALIYDAGLVRTTHMDFAGRITVISGGSLSTHSTHVAGSVGGSGAASYQRRNRGMAPGVQLLSAQYQPNGGGVIFYTDPGNMEAIYSAAIHNNGADIANNSVGANVAGNGYPCSLEGDYGLTSGLIDSVVRGSLGETFLLVFSAGNERGNGRCGTGYGTITPPAAAKNSIVVGALNSNDDSMTAFSSWGPVDDGRIKPDLCAGGCQTNGDLGVTSCSATNDTAYESFCGTSYAAPVITGLGALILEDYRAQFVSNPPAQYPNFRNSTLKMLLLHTARDVLNPGPDYQSGYGSPRVQSAIDFMRTRSFMEAPVAQGGTVQFPVHVRVGQENLKITLAWDDPAATSNVTRKLVNDLDLRVLGPDGTRYFPWTLDPANPGAGAVRTAEDHINNVEQVYVENPMPGDWHVEVVGTDVPMGPQVFSIGASPAVPCACDYNRSGRIDSQDLFDFLNDFFAGNADFNGSGVTDSQDFYAFLACFQTACP